MILTMKDKTVNFFKKIFFIHFFFAIFAMAYAITKHNVVSFKK